MSNSLPNPFKPSASKEALLKCKGAATFLKCRAVRTTPKLAAGETTAKPSDQTEGERAVICHQTDSEFESRHSSSETPSGNHSPTPQEKYLRKVQMERVQQWLGIPTEPTAPSVQMHQFTPSEWGSEQDFSAQKVQEVLQYGTPNVLHKVGTGVGRASGIITKFLVS